MSSVAYIMQWGDHKTNVHNHLRLLFEEQKFVDLTLFCSTHSVKVHSVVIASNSSYFEKVLLSQNGVNSVIVLKDMKFEVLRALIEFMYCGETTVLDEDVDALLYASKKFDVKGLSRMTRQGVMFSAAEKSDNEGAEPNHRFIFPAESAQPGMIQAVIDLTKKKTDQVSSLEATELDSLYFKKTVFQRRGRPHKKHGNIGFPEAAMSDTEYAILKEAEESRKALEKLQKYVLNPNGTENGTSSCQTLSKSGDDPFPTNGKPQTEPEETKSQDHSYSNLRHEDKIAADNLTNELNHDPHRQQQHQHQQNDVLLPTDVPIFVDDGNGNYVTLDVEMANMIAGQEIKYNLVQGVVMTSDGKGSQHSNPASILIPETQFQPEGMPILNYDPEELPKFENYFLPDTGNPFKRSNGSQHNSRSGKCFGSDLEDNSPTQEMGKYQIKRKPFVVREIIKLKQPRKNLSQNGNGRSFGTPTKEPEDAVSSTNGKTSVKFDDSVIQGILF